MVRPNRDRKLISVWLDRTGLAVIDDYARQADVTRSDMIRALLAEAVAARQKTRGTP